jgi:HlyD family secretion protein
MGKDAHERDPRRQRRSDVAGNPVFPVAGGHEFRVTFWRSPRLCPPHHGQLVPVRRLAVFAVPPFTQPFSLLLHVMAKSKSYGGLIFLLLVVVAGGVGSWFYFKKAADKAPEFQTSKVMRGDITQAVTATGDLQPVMTVDVSSQISGQIQEVLVDFNFKVKAGDVLARIDPATQVQNVKQSEADLASAEANNRLLRLNADRTRDLFSKKLVAQQELDSIEAQLAQSDATLLTRKAALENAKLNVARCTIYAPIDGMVLARLTDKGRTVAASLNAPTLFTLVNDLSKMQILAAVAEADIGSIAEGQDVTFSVDAFPNRTFRGTIAQVRNNATTQSSVVSYATIISVSNEDLKLKPGMTANVSIIVAQRPGVLRVENSVLRVRIPPELLPKPPAAAPGEKAAPVAMTEGEKRTAIMGVMREAGMQFGQPVSPDVIEKAKKLGAEKGLTAEDITQFQAAMAARMAAGGGGGGGPGGGGRRGGGGGGPGGGGAPVATTRTLYKLTDPAAKEKKIEAIPVRLGISDGFTTEVLSGLNEGDTLVKGVIMPGAAPVLQAPGASAQNPFQGGGRGPGMGGMGGGGMGGGGGGRR